MRLFDISVEVAPDLAVWPHETRAQIRQTMAIEAGDIANVSEVSIGVHTGTHIDAPYHFMRNGKTVNEIPLAEMIGKVYVFSLPNADQIDVQELESLNIPQDAERILFRTRNSSLWKTHRTEFYSPYVALTSRAASWLASRNMRLVGIDYLSIQRFDDEEPLTHITLLSAGVIILEGLDLSHVPEGVYMLYCLPLKLAAKDGAPVRAILTDG